MGEKKEEPMTNKRLLVVDPTATVTAQARTGKIVLTLDGSDAAYAWDCSVLVVPDTSYACRRFEKPTNHFDIVVQTVRK